MFLLTCSFLSIIIFIVIPILIIVAFYTLLERKIMGAVQRRRGPNVVGFFGLLQPIADGLKLVFKEIIVPRKANYYLFILSPIITFTLSFFLWYFVPYFFFWQTSRRLFLNTLLVVFAISSLSIFGIVGSGWASNSKYALLGALRSAAQMISYEISLGFVFLAVSFLSESVDLQVILNDQYNIPNFFPLFPLSLIFFVSILAETNRAPFDLPEAEAEIVAGYNIEYSGIAFALFFLGEYSNMFLMSMLFVLLFLGSGPVFTFFSVFIFFLKTSIIASIFIFVRAALPRVRYDQLMYLGWQIFLPFSLAFFFFLITIFFIDDLSYFWNDVLYSDMFLYLRRF